MKGSSESQQLKAPKVSILKNLISKINTGSGKRKPRVVEIRLAGQEYEQESRLSFTSGTEQDDKSSNESIKPNGSAIFRDFSSESEHKYSQNRQFLDRIQKVYNRKFKVNSNKVKANQVTTEKPIDKGGSKTHLGNN